MMTTMTGDNFTDAIIDEVPTCERNELLTVSVYRETGLDPRVVLTDGNADVAALDGAQARRLGVALIVAAAQSD